MSGRRVAARGLGSAAAIAALIVFVPRAAALNEDALTCSLAAAALLVVAALLCLLGRVWSGIAATLAAVAMVRAFAGLPAGVDRTAVAVGAAALPLIPPMLAASVTTKRWLATVGVSCGAVAGPLHALLYDPFLDPACRVGCAHSPLVVAHRPTLAVLAEHGGTWAAAGVIILLIPGAQHRIAMVAAAIAAGSLAVSNHPAVLLAASAVVVVALVSDAVSTIMIGTRLRDLIAALGSSLDLQQTLRTAIDDGGLTVAYALDDSAGNGAGVLVARDGTASPPPTTQQVSTAVRSDVDILAWIRHSAGRDDVERLAVALNGPARLAFEVERLEAVAAVHSRRIVDSRARIVESGDLERRRLERDIHDGAQQYVLSLGMQIEVALLDVEPDDARHSLLEVSLTRVRATLNELRDIAHGLRPFPLEVAGLDTALHAFARRSGVAVTIGPIPRRRFGIETESAVLAVVRSAIDAASGPIDVGVSDHGFFVELTIGSMSAPAVLAVASDRVAAIGGWVGAEANTITAVIPCAS